MARALRLSLALAAMLIAAPANAATLLTVENGGEIAFALPGGSGGYDLPASSGAAPGDLVKNTNAPLEGLKLDGPSSLFFTFMGKEASFTDIFNFMVGDVNVFNNQTSVVGTTTGPFAVSAADLLLSGGFVPFKFISNSPPGTDLINGAITSLIGSIAFKLIGAENDGVMTYLALLNDTHPSTPDYDDMVIKITAIRSGGSTGLIPIPAGLVLLLSGLMGLGFLGRARTKSA